MDGNIGVVVNGAGLALATHDILIDAGGRMSQQIAKGIGLLLADSAVVILVNVHGGGMTSCDARGKAEELGLLLN